MDFNPWTLNVPQEVSLYWHVPFCESKCNYCDFFSIVPQNQEIIEAIVRKTLVDFECLLGHQTSTQIQTIYFGGGTPSILPQNLWGLILESLSKSLPSGWNSQFFTVEANPSSLKKDLMELWQDFGVGRLSVGVQSFNPQILNSISRKNDADSLRNLSKLLPLWQGEKNLDFIAGLPGQTWLDLKTDLNRALDLGVDHISLYALTLEPGTRLFEICSERPTFIPLEEARDHLWFQGKDYLLSQGYTQYEISNFSKPGKESVHNLKYWNLDNYWGVGPGAFGSWISTDGNLYRINNSENLTEFLEKPLIDQKPEKIPPSDRLKDLVLMSFRTNQGLEIQKWDKWSPIPWEIFAKKIKPNWKFIKTENRWALTPSNRLFLNLFLHDIFNLIEKINFMKE